uniref:Uncharacterized protein n=1 Tax=Manihot esculenta TaxID=3983 RepID=A0A2C9W835_MANES
MRQKKGVYIKSWLPKPKSSKNNFQKQNSRATFATLSRMKRNRMADRQSAEKKNRKIHRNIWVIKPGSPDIIFI